MKTNETLKWTKTEAGYEAKSAFGHYEARRFERKSITRKISGFVLVIDGDYDAGVDYHLLRDAKTFAQKHDDIRFEQAQKEAAEREAVEAPKNLLDQTTDLFLAGMKIESPALPEAYEAPETAEEVTGPVSGLDASDVQTLLRPELVGDILREEEQIVANPGRDEARAERIASMPGARKAPKPVEKKAAGLAAKVARNLAEEPAPARKGSHIVIVARAGTGKTTTLIGGLYTMRGLPLSYTPSDQQRAIFDALSHFSSARFVGFVAYNKPIADELRGRVPEGVDAMTFHSMGLKAVRKAFPFVSIDDKGALVQGHIASILERDIRDIRRDDFLLLKATGELVSLAKANLVGDAGGFKFTEDLAPELEKLAAHYDIDLVDDDGKNYSDQVYRLVPEVLRRCLDVSKNRQVDFDDMCWLPVVLNLPMFRYDVLMVDEAQDLNRNRQALAMKAGRTLVVCGDPRQAIYGFAGADTKSMDRMQAELAATAQGVSVFPLTFTRRCGKAIVEEAKAIVPDFSGFEGNCAGKIAQADFPNKGPNNYRAMAADGDMVLCRVNAPLVSACFGFIKAGRKANIQGRNIAEGLLSLVKKLRASDSADLVQKVTDWCADEVEKENRKKFPSEGRIISIQDKADCLLCFTEGVKTVDEVTAKINAIFTDNPNSPGIRLSSIHRSKGLEARRVFVLQPKGGTVPHPMAKSVWQREQEMNLKYVAITRAVEELVWVNERE